MRNDKPNLIVDLSFKFAVDVVNFCDEIEARRKYLLARQLFKSGTSIGANIREAQNAESTKDFIHKMKIAAKEADETIFWLELTNRVERYPTNSKLLEDVVVLMKIISKIIGTTKRKLQK
jgi:four helix bundle protein